jgi:uncharacterized membrane protein YbaN (DUF454 family)
VPSRVLYLSFAGVSFVLAVLGVVLPLLPTTPFLLITSWCLVRSSPRLHAKLRNQALFGPLLRDWDEHHAVTLNVKITAIATMAIVVTASLIFGNLPPWAAATLIVAASVGLVVILRLTTLRRN